MPCQNQLFCWTHSTLSSASKCDRVNQNKRNNQKICEKVKFDKDLNWLGTSFSWYQSQKSWCHWNSPIFNYMWLSSHEFWWHTWNIYRWFVQAVIRLYLNSIATYTVWCIWILTSMPRGMWVIFVLANYTLESKCLN